MFNLNGEHRYYLYAQACDMRKSFDGLCGTVLGELGREPADGSVYVFLNRRRTHLKLLHWESGGFVLYYKRLESGVYARPRLRSASGLVCWPDLVLMIAGIEVSGQRQKKRFKG